MAVKGSLKDIPFSELLQLMHLTRKTGRIEVSVDKRWALVVIKEGTVWHVEPRGFQGISPEEVLYTLVGLQEGDFIFQRVQVLPVLERTVHQATESLLLEGTKRLDDERALATEAGGGEKSRNVVLRLKPGAEAKVRYVPQNVKKVLQAIDGTRNTTEVIKNSQLDASQASQIIKELLNHGILETVESAKSEEETPQETGA